MDFSTSLVGVKIITLILNLLEVLVYSDIIKCISPDQNSKIRFFWITRIAFFVEDVLVKIALGFKSPLEPLAHYLGIHKEMLRDPLTRKYKILSLSGVQALPKPCLYGVLLFLLLWLSQGRHLERLLKSDLCETSQKFDHSLVR